MSDDLVKRLRERAGFAASEGDMTAKCDANHFTEAAERIEALESEVGRLQSLVVEASANVPHRIQGDAAMNKFSDNEIAEAARRGFVFETLVNSGIETMRRHGLGGKFVTISVPFNAPEGQLDVTLHAPTGHLITSDRATGIKFAIDTAHAFLMFESAVKIRSACDVETRSHLKAGYYVEVSR